MMAEEDASMAIDKGGTLKKKHGRLHSTHEGNPIDS